MNRTVCMCIVGYSFCISLSCSDLVTEVAVPELRGRVVDAAGAPVAGATVYAYDRSFEPALSDTGAARALRAWDSDITDQDGRYELTLAVRGLVAIIVDAPNATAACVDSVMVLGNNTVNVTDAVVRVPGSITGTTVLAGHPADSQPKVKIFIPGTYLVTVPDTAGTFSLDNVPEGRYRIVFEPSVTNSFGRQTSATVVTAASTSIDTIVLYSDSLRGKPLVDAGRDTLASPGDMILLNGTVSDTFGQIVRYEWQISADSSFNAVSSPDTIIVLPDTIPMQLLCILRVTDNDSNKVTDTVRIHIADTSFSELSSMCLGSSSSSRWNPNGECRLILADSAIDGAADSIALIAAHRPAGYAIQWLVGRYDSSIADTTTPKVRAQILDYIGPDSASSVYTWWRNADSLSIDTLLLPSFADSIAVITLLSDTVTTDSTQHVTTMHVLRAHLNRFCFELAFEGLSDSSDVVGTADTLLKAYEEKL